MIDFLIEVLTVAADFLSDLWINKIIRRRKKK